MTSPSMKSSSTSTSPAHDGRAVGIWLAAWAILCFAIVLVGGAPLNEEFGKAVGADAYCRDAAVAAETAQALVLAKRAAATAS